MIEPQARRAGIRVGEGPLGTIIRDRQPRHVVVGSDAWHGFDVAAMVGHGIGSFVGYPLLVADRPVGVLAVYAAGPVSDLLVTAMSATVASLALAVAAGEIE